MGSLWHSCLVRLIEFAQTSPRGRTAEATEGSDSKELRQRRTGKGARSSVPQHSALAPDSGGVPPDMHPLCVLGAQSQRPTAPVPGQRWGSASCPASELHTQDQTPGRTERSGEVILLAFTLAQDHSGQVGSAIEAPGSSASVNP